MKFGSRLKRWFLTGIILLVPVLVTFYLLAAVVHTMDGVIHLIPPAYQPVQLVGFNIPGLGLILTVLLVLLTGMIGASLIGRRLVRFGETLLGRIPLVRAVYGSLKHVLETILHNNKDTFRRVVMIEYPRRGLYALAFVTGTDRGEVQHNTSSNVIAVFVPTTPNPTSGFLLYVPEGEVVPMQMTVEQGMKCVISGGVISPPWPPEEDVAIEGEAEALPPARSS